MNRLYVAMNWFGVRCQASNHPCPVLALRTSGCPFYYESGYRWPNQVPNNAKLNMNRTTLTFMPKICTCHCGDHGYGGGGGGGCCINFPRTASQSAASLPGMPLCAFTCLISNVLHNADLSAWGSVNQIDAHTHRPLRFSCLISASICCHRSCNQK